MLKATLISFVIVCCISYATCQPDKVDTGVAADSNIPGVIINPFPVEPVLQRLRCGAWRRATYNYCYDLNNQFHHIVARTLWVADCNASPQCPFRHFLESEIADEDVKEYEMNGLATAEVQKWRQLFWRCRSIQGTFSAWDCRTGKRVSCKYSRSCECRPGWVFPWDHVPYESAVETVE